MDEWVVEQHPELGTDCVKREFFVGCSQRLVQRREPANFVDLQCRINLLVLGMMSSPVLSVFQLCRAGGRLKYQVQLWELLQTRTDLLGMLTRRSTQTSRILTIRSILIRSKVAAYQLLSIQ